MKRRIITIFAITALLFSSCGKEDNKDEIYTATEEQIEESKTIINNIGAIDPNNPEQDKDSCDFSYIPAIYMQDYDYKEIVSNWKHGRDGYCFRIVFF